MSLLLLALPLQAQACSPILPMFYLLTGPSVVGTGVITSSVMWLLVAVLVKSAAFARFERRLSPGKAGCWMLLANVVSTLPGVFIALVGSNPPAFLLSFPFLILLAWMIRRRTRQMAPPFGWRWLSGRVTVGVFLVAVVISAIVYNIGFHAGIKYQLGTYWASKLVAVTIVAAMGLLVSTLLEESVIAHLATRQLPLAAFYESVFRANYLTLGGALLVAAIKSLPERMKDPGFLFSR